MLYFLFIYSPVASYSFNKAQTRIRASLSDNQGEMELTGGVKAGINIANVSGDDVENADSKLGLIGGGFLTYKISDMFAIQPELLFTMKGSKSKETDAIGTSETTINYNGLGKLDHF